MHLVTEFEKKYIINDIWLPRVLTLGANVRLLEEEINAMAETGSSLEELESFLVERLVRMYHPFPGLRAVLEAIKHLDEKDG